MVRLSAKRNMSDIPANMAQFIVGLIYAVPDRPQISDEEAETIQQAHLANIRRLRASGELVLAGPFVDDEDLRGMFVFNVPTIEHAQALVATDPAIQAGRLQVELHPWWGQDTLPNVNRST